MAGKLKLTVACGDYEIVRALKEGAVEADGLDLVMLTGMGPRERHWRMARRAEFDVCEANVGAYFMERDQGAALASEASGQRGNSIVRAPDTRPEPGSSARAAFDRGSPRHPGFHKTSSVDYAIVLSGEIYALMDEGEVLLKAGDVLVQRGTNHAWSNRTDAPAYLAFVLVDAEPV
jgi:quercetin dioxygenase-like cupin family protein